MRPQTALTIIDGKTPLRVLDAYESVRQRWEDNAPFEVTVLDAQGKTQPMTLRAQAVLGVRELEPAKQQPKAQSGVVRRVQRGARPFWPG